MNEERINQAMELLRLARQHLVAATETPDTVEERRQMVRAAHKFRTAADICDDQGNLTE